MTNENNSVVTNQNNNTEETGENVVENAEQLEQSAVTEPATDSNVVAPESFLTEEDVKEDINYEFETSESFDSEFIDSYKNVAKDLSLSQENAQKVLDTFSKYETDRINKTANMWLEQTKADKEIGGENLEKSKSLVKKALSAFASPQLKEFLTKGAIGNNPEVIRFLVNVGKSVSEDTTIIQGGSTRQQVSDPNQPATFESFVVSNYGKKM